MNHDDYDPTDDDEFTCPVCRGTRTIQPDRFTAPEECPRCVDPDADDSSDLEQHPARRSGGESIPASEPTHPACRWPAGDTAAQTQCDVHLRHTDANDERKMP